MLTFLASLLYGEAHNNANSLAHIINANFFSIIAKGEAQSNANNLTHVWGATHTR